MKSVKVILELEKVDYEFLCQALDSARRETRRGNLAQGQKALRLQKLHALQSHLEDSWENATTFANWATH